MLTYDLSDASKGALYETLYKDIRDDIKSGTLKAGEKLPSKRTLAKNLGVSTITVESAYAQLISEGYVYSLPKRGYFVAKLDAPIKAAPAEKPLDTIILPAPRPHYAFDFSRTQTNPDQFPFATWKKLLREVIAEESQALMEKSPSGGVWALRRAIAGHLRDFRGIDVHPDQIIVGAGTEYLYSLLIQLLGRDKVYCTENPGYRKIPQIYRAQGVCCRFADMDEQGVTVSGLRAAGADIAHIGPTHQFPTGITMPVSRRYELLAWASEADERAIIEDDYDSEFRWGGKPLPTMFGMDASGRVIYMNTFSMTIAPSVRISYVCLPQELYERWKERLGFCSCPVPAFEQYTLARFIESGHFERHISRMRKYYRRIRELTLALAVRTCGEDSISEENAGLHFLMDIPADSGLPGIFTECGVRVTPLDEYYDEGSAPPDSAAGRFVVNYSAADEKKLSEQ